MNYRDLISLALLVTSALVVSHRVSAAPWHHPLYLSNGGYWPLRVAVTIENDSDIAVAGEPVAVPVSVLAGQRAESLRVCNAGGVELLFNARRTGTLSSNDVVFVPVEVGATSSTTIYLYAGNDAALPVPEFFAAGFVNGDFEDGTNGWKAVETDSRHTATYEAFGGRNGSAGVKVEVAPGAEPTWVKWHQTGIRVVPSRGYRFTAWVRGENVIGSAGWFLHVNGERPMLINRLLEAGNGSFDWKKVTFSFTAPATAHDITVGTVLRGTGRAWFDDAEFIETGEKPSLRVTVGDIERLKFHAARDADGTVVRVLNPADRPIAEALVSVEARRVRSLFPVSALPARSVTEILFRPEWDHQRLVNSPLNLAPRDGIHGWARFGAAKFSEQRLEFTVPAGATPNWTGWRSEPIPVEPNATYLYSGFLKAKGVSGTATLHAHVHRADGKTMFVSTQPHVSNDSEWVKSSTFIQTPADAKSVTLHLTMNAHGTLHHERILFCRVLPGEIVRAPEARPMRGLRVWEVNPLIKVFPDDAPGKSAQSVSVECARNEYEPFQLALRSAVALRNVQVSVSELRNRKGDRLPAVKVDRVGFVPIDHPSGYFHSDAKDWERRVPRGRGATDGWAGEWPDPLIPNAPFDLPSGRTQPLWFTVFVPEEAAPGEYQGEITITADVVPTTRLPTRITVLPFALPKTPRLKAIFDFRFHGDRETRRTWLRFMAERRLGISHIEPPVFTYKDGQVRMDAAAFDEDARFCFDELGMSVAYTPSFFYMFGWAYPPKKIFGLEPFTPAYNEALQQAYRLFVEHLKRRGWRDKFVYYISDEPHFHNHQFVVEQMKKLCALIHEVDTTIPIYSSTWRYCPQWETSLDLWGVGQYGCFPVEQMERLRKAGKNFWFTCDGQMATDTPYLATERMLPYYCFKYGATGFEFWGINWFTYDPWERGWHRFIRQSDDGKRHYWIRYPNGDGYLAYPGQRVGVNGPVSTIRLEQVREGLEDYEALALLTGLLAKAGRPNAAAERALTMARELVTIPNAGGLRSTEILPDPDQIPKIRKAINTAIVDMLQ